MDELAMIISTTAKPGRRSDIQALFRELMAPRAIENEAQRVVVWCDDQQDEDRFHLFEIYSDPAAMGANSSAPWFAEYMEKAGPLLAREPSVVMATTGWSKGV